MQEETKKRIEMSISPVHTEHRSTRLRHTSSWTCLHVVLPLLLAFAFSGSLHSAYAQTPFDHFSTGFPLTGAHTNVACESCHVRGVMKGTPKKCAGCHNGVTAVGQGSTHPLTSAPCEACHAPNNVTFSITTAFDHLDIRSGCNNCHLKDQSAAHIPVPAGAECNLCHRTPPDTFDAAGLFNHSNVSSMRCDACHNGAFTASGAFGKSASHRPIVPGQDCHACHDTNSFAGAGFDHTGISDGCNTCHLKDQPANHIPTPPGSQCVLCHRVYPDSFVQAAAFSHASVRVMRCDACHNGSFASYGSPGKTATHPPTKPAEDCGDCHSTNSFANASFDHAATTSGCSTCHADDLPGLHIPRPAGSECVLCHRVPPPDDFTVANAFNHSNVTAMRCDACHNGAFIGDGALGKTATHPATQPGQDCNACHRTTTSFANPNFDHTGITTGCNSCHAADKAANHIPVPVGSECVLCHRVKPDLWTNAATFSHSFFSAQRCDVCHNGAYTGAGALGKTPKHPPTLAGQDCNVCHANTVSFVGAAFDHASAGANQCNACHLPDKSPTHIPLPVGSQCSMCHRTPPETFATAATFDHGLVSAIRCDACHNGAFTRSGAVGKGAAHVPTAPGQDCNICHNIPPDTFAGATTFTHAKVAAQRCDACHSGAFTTAGAIGKGTVHLPTATGQDCAACHSIPPASFTTAASFNHNLVTTLRCDACHNGAFAAAGAIGKSADHPATAPGLDCNVCHKDTTTFANPVAFSHVGVTTGCNSCHLSQKPASHIPVPAAAECILCHRVPPDAFTTAATFTHGSVAAMRCDACHNGSFTAAGAVGKGASHIPTATGQDCKSCHRVPPEPFTMAATFNHTSVTSLRCDACHNGAFTAAGAVGKSVGHPATAAGQDCNACHKDTTSFAGAVGFNHAGVTTGCNGCHAKDKPANHLPVPTGSECVLCHRVPPDSFATATAFNHANVASMRCDVCHNGAFATAGAAGKGGKHIPTVTGQDCGSCHRLPPDTLAQARAFSHTSVSSLRCDGCHNGQYTGSGAQGKPGDHPRIPAGADCNASGCHRSTSSW